MRVGLLTTSYPRYDGDHAGLFVRGFARSLVGRDHEVHVLAPEPLAAPADAPSTSDHGIRVERVAYLRPRSLQRTFYGAGTPENLRTDALAWPGLLTYPPLLWRAANRNLTDCDALVSHWALPNAIVAGAIAKGRPHLAVLHSADVHLLGRMPAGEHLCRAILQSASNLVFVSDEARERFSQRALADATPWTSSPHWTRRLLRAPPLERRRTEKLLAERCHCCPMGIDAPGRGPERDRARKGLGFDRFTLLFLGRLVPIKGLVDLIEAVAGRADLLLVVAGDGPERPSLTELARRVKANVRFVGYVAGRDKAELLAGADALLMPSRRLPSGRSEGTPVALLEGMAAGLPIIATRVGGISSLLGDGRQGLLVPERSPNDLRTAIDRLQHDPELRARLADAGQRCSESYHWPTLARSYEALLKGERPEFPLAE